MYSTEEMTDIEGLIGLLKSKIKTPFPMPNKEFNALPKMANAKRKEFGDKFKIFKDNNSFLSDSTAIGYMTVSIGNFDQSTLISSWIAGVDDKLWRNGDIAGFQAMTQIAFCDLEARLKAKVPNSDAVEAVNALDDLKTPRKPSEPKQPPTDSPDAKK
jgi:hypothetical protein